MKTIILSAILLAALTTVRAQESATPDAYTRAVSFLWENVNNKKAFQLQVIPNWFADSTGFWYMHSSNSGSTFTKVLFKPLGRSPLFDHTKVAVKLTAALKEPVEADKLPIENLKYLDKDLIQFNVKDRRFSYHLTGDKLDEESGNPPSSSNEFEATSPDGKWVAYTDKFNLFIKSTNSGTVKQLSTAGKKNYEYSSEYGWSDIMVGEGGERPRQFDVRWSPDSKWIQTSICDLRFARKMYLLDWGVDTLYRARLLSYYRGSPGDTSIVHYIPVVFNIETGKETKLAMPRIAHENSYSFDWTEKPGIAIAEYRDRGFQKAHVLKIDLNTGIQQKLLSDSSRTNVDGFNTWLLEKKGKLIFTSERSGWKQLYAVDLNSKVVTPITTGSYFINSLVYSDPSGDGTLYFTASGKEPGRNPYEQRLYCCGLNGKGMKLLTPEADNHDLSISPDHRFFIDNYSTPQQPTVSVLRELKTGKIVMEISKASIEGLTAMNWKAPEPFTAMGKDGKTTIHGLLWKPSNFDPSKKYPVVDNSYTGPHTQIVPRNFVRVLNINNQPIAELGFVVIMVDGLGTAGRSKEFHNHSYKRMGFNLEDHVRAIKQLASQFSWIDASRVGIFGHSAGGYDAGHAVLQYPEFYKVAVASSADHDHRMEKAWWPEMYMGWPVDSAYHNQSNITMANRLKGKLLITHGGIDENVNPSATFKLAEVLIRADKQFDMLILPSQRHGYQGQHQKYFTKKRWNYFVEHLGGQKPIWEFDWK